MARKITPDDMRKLRMMSVEARAAYLSSAYRAGANSKGGSDSSPPPEPSSAGGVLHAPMTVASKIDAGENAVYLEAKRAVRRKVKRDSDAAAAAASVASASQPSVLTEAPNNKRSFTNASTYTSKDELTRSSIELARPVVPAKSPRPATAPASPSSSSSASSSSSRRLAKRDGSSSPTASSTTTDIVVPGTMDDVVPSSKSTSSRGRRRRRQVPCSPDSMLDEPKSDPLPSSSSSSSCTSSTSSSSSGGVDVPSLRTALVRHNSFYWLDKPSMLSHSVTLPDMAELLLQPSPRVSADTPRSHVIKLRRGNSDSNFKRMPSLQLRRTGSSEDLAQAMKLKEEEIDRMLAEQRSIDATLQQAEVVRRTTPLLSVGNDSSTVKFVCVSDTHTHHQSLRPPAGDVLIHAGDFSYTGSLKEVQSFCDWLDKQPHRIKIVIAGNHDTTMQPAFYEKEHYRWHKQREDHRAVRALLFQHCTYLEDSAVLIDGIKLYGSPWQPWFLNWAFNLQRGRELLEKWSAIPADTDVLITHGPPYGHGDGIKGRGGFIEHVGCEDLMRVVRIVKPKYHVFGHVHEAAGISKTADTTFINACICTADYKPWGRSHVFELPKRELDGTQSATDIAVRSLSSPTLSATT